VGGSVISDSRILADDGETVVIGTKNYREGGRFEPLAMPGVEFARRFVLHILPPRMHRVRYGGLYSPEGRKQRLPLARQRITQQNPALSGPLTPQPEAANDRRPPQVSSSEPHQQEAPETQQQEAPGEQSSDDEQTAADELLDEDAEQDAPREYTPTCPRCQMPGMKAVGHFTARQLAAFLLQLRFFGRGCTTVIVTLPYERRAFRHAPQLFGDAAQWLTFTLTTMDVDAMSYCDAPPPDT
jgi:hypothetical protein